MVYNKNIVKEEFKIKILQIEINIRNLDCFFMDYESIEEIDESYKKVVKKYFKVNNKIKTLKGWIYGFDPVNKTITSVNKKNPELDIIKMLFQYKPKLLQHCHNYPLDDDDDFEL